jgi:hypothetical protein
MIMIDDGAAADEEGHGNSGKSREDGTRRKLSVSAAMRQAKF